MSEMKRKTTSVSLTIGSSVKESSSTSVHQSSSTLIQPISIDGKQVQNTPASHSVASSGIAPVFTKNLQNISTSKGQLVVFECRIRATPPLQVHWFREHHPIIDSADFRILRKKEVCTLVITEAYPEDSGLFKCIAENSFGVVASSAHLFVFPEPNDIDIFEALQAMPVLEDAVEKLYFQNKNQNFTTEPQASDTEPHNASQKTSTPDNLFSHYGLQNDDVETIEGFEAAPDSGSEPETGTDWDTPFSDRDFASCHNISSAETAGHKKRQDFSPGDQSPISPQQISHSGTKQNRQEEPGCIITNSPPISSVRPPTMFNYERPKHFIQAQPACPAQCSPQVTATSKPSPSSPSINSPKYFSSASFASTMESARHSSSSATQFPTGPSQGQKAALAHDQTPAAFLSSVLPSHSEYTNSHNAPTAVESSYSEPMYRKMPKQPQPTTEHQIQGTKDALMQDLERKLRFKDNILQNGNQRLSYEERMARRLLGPENAASVFEMENVDGTQDSEQHLDYQASQTTQDRGRPTSRGEVNRSIQEKLFPPRFLTIPGDIEAEEGRFCRIDFKVTGLPAPDVTWYLNGRPVRTDDFHKMIVSEKGFHSLIFEVVRPSDAGEYECAATNRAGKATFRMQLEVLAHERRRMPSFIQKPQSVRALEGDTVRIECHVSAVPFPQILLKRNNEMLQYNTDRIRLLQDSNGKICLIMYNVNKKDDGWYTISAVNQAGVATCHARIDVGTRMNANLSAAKPLKVRPTFSIYSTLERRAQAAKSEPDFHQAQPSYPGVYESEEL
ncbi:myotilin isoform X2 [Ambystoma mexicanum]|uniref:myotilin isoform X2 n=1 Tax=Ambystoma mexicanum TaxID=8296 RepID=UPI0037E73CA9